MNFCQRIRSWLTTRLFIPIVLSICSFSVQAIPLTIDKELSQVTYVSATPSFVICNFTSTLGSAFGLPICPPSPGPEVFKISGVIELDINLPYLDLRSDKLLTDASSKGFLLGQPFAVETGRLSGINFETFNNPCFSFIGPGSCWSLERFPAINTIGTWDGQFLTWEGTQARGLSPQDGNFVFSIVASASQIPAPGTLLLLIMSLAITQASSGFSLFKHFVIAKSKFT